MRKNKVSASILQNMKQKVETRKDMKEVLPEYKSIINYTEYELQNTEVEKIIKCEEKVVSSAHSLKKDLLELAEGLAEAQKIFANNKNGSFQKWFETLGLKKTFVYTLLNRQELYLEFNDEKVFQVPERVLPEIKKIKENVSSEEVIRIINSDRPMEEVKNIVRQPNDKNIEIEEIEIVETVDFDYKSYSTILNDIDKKVKNLNEKNKKELQKSLLKIQQLLK